MSQTYAQVDPASLKDVLNLLQAYREGGKKALQRSVNHGARRGRKISVDEMARKVALKKKVIRAHTSMYFASLSNLTAKLVIQGKPVPLIEYGARQTKKGVTFRIWKDGKRERYRHAFIAQITGSQAKGVYERDIGASTYNGRTPLRAKRGPAIPNVYDQTPGLAKKAEEFAANEMLKELDRQIGLIERGFF